MAEEGLQTTMLQLQSDPAVLRGCDCDIPWFEEKSVIRHFGRDSFREFQRETIVDICSAYSAGYRHVILDAPTGSGKSEIGACLARASNNAHILTVQKLLQDQYQAAMLDFSIMKGRGSYSCVASEGVSCAEGPCRLRKRAACGECPYKLAKLKAMASPVTVHNFDSFYYQNSFGSGFPGRKLIVIDECHSIPQKFSEFLSFTISSKSGIVVPEADNISQYDSFVRGAYDEYASELEILQLQFDVDGLSKDGLRRMQELSTLVHRMKRYLSERSRDDPAEYVFDYTTFGRNAPSVTFRPVNVGTTPPGGYLGMASAPL